MNELESQCILFKLNEQAEKFEIVDLEENKVHDILKSNNIYIIVDSIDKNVWIWNGKESNVRMKFIASQHASEIRDCYGIDYKISSVDEGDESQVFKNFIDLF